MGRVRNKTVKRASRKVVELYYSKLTLDFHTNKRLIDEVAEVQTKKLRNKIAGYTTHLMRRLQRNPVKGISLKLQEEERERRLDFIPNESILGEKPVMVSPETYSMVQKIPNFDSMDKIEVGDGRKTRYNPKPFH
eukprot:TRINITY_DN637_c0_g1_i10.p2 TRINITY_DN637_c0_g1~~TRINITY_DN637_c0_g1_i10.p2  ORF type:complete len:135 (+),score=47.76 TRINITY_DN637_c0_g1_i10:122-526(+)